MRAIDTNVLLRLVVADDLSQGARARAFVETGAWISHVVLAEAVWVLQSVYHRSDQQAGDAIAELLEHGELTVQDRDVAVTALERFRAARGVSFSDCLVLEISRKAGHSPLGTFDRKLSRIDGAVRI